jgi:hypothetical protein
MRATGRYDNYHVALLAPLALVMGMLYFGISAAFWSGAVVYGLALASMVVITGRSAPAASLETGEPRPSALVTASG